MSIGKVCLRNNRRRLRQFVTLCAVLGSARLLREFILAQTAMRKKILVAHAILLVPLSSLADHAALQIDGGPGSAITTMGAETLPKGQQTLALQYQYLDLDELSDQELLDSEDSLHSVNAFSQASIGYSVGITDRFTLSVALPYVSRDGFREESHDHEDEDDHHDEETPQPDGEVIDSNISGWGDVSMLGRFALHTDKPAKRYYALLAGLKAPTGNTNEKLSDGEKAEVDHQPGSGSWDPLLGVAYSNSLSAQWSVSSNLLYHLTTEGERETTIGDNLLYNAAVLWSPASQSHRHSHHDAASNHHTEQAWQYVLELNGEWHDKTEIDGSQDDNTGGDVIFASAGLRWSYGDWGTHLSVGTPLYKNLNGEQSEPDWQLSAGVSIAF